MSFSLLKPGDYSQTELEAAFDLVKPAFHWKDRINTVIPRGSDCNLISAAIVHFTGSIPTFSLVRKSGDLRVQAAGYWETIGS